MSSCGCTGNMTGGAKRKSRKMKRRQRRASRKGTRKQMKKSRRQLRKHNRKLSRRHRRNRRKSRQSMKGGYHQFHANQPLTNGQQVAGAALAAKDSALANPAPYSPYNNTVDNYNHFKGTGSETGVFDKAAPKN